MGELAVLTASDLAAGGPMEREHRALDLCDGYYVRIGPVDEGSTASAARSFRSLRSADSEAARRYQHRLHTLLAAVSRWENVDFIVGVRATP
jgi:hypothetical protein